MYSDFCIKLSSFENKEVYLKAIQSIKGNIFIDIRKFENSKPTNNGVILTPIDFIWMKKYLKSGFCYGSKLIDNCSTISIDRRRRRRNIAHAYSKDQ